MSRGTLGTLVANLCQKGRVFGIEGKCFFFVKIIDVDTRNFYKPSSPSLPHVSPNFVWPKITKDILYISGVRWGEGCWPRAGRLISHTNYSWGYRKMSFKYGDHLTFFSCSGNNVNKVIGDGYIPHVIIHS